MNDPTLIFLVWLGLGIVMVSYVIYRLIKDPKKNSEKQNTFHPLTSNPGDKMFPERSDTLGWIAYIFMVIGLSAILSILFFLIFGNNNEFPIWLIHVFGIFFYTGLLLQSINKMR